MLQLSKMQTFIFSEASILAWAASVQRSNLYDQRIGLKDRRSAAFQAAVLEFVETKLISKYEAEQTESAHLKNIESLVVFGNAAGAGLLGDAGYKFGIAQKLLNLLLKYLWCLGHIVEPPHCPVDRRVLRHTALRGKLNWTEIVSVDTYKEAIEAIRAEATKGGLTLAQWELENFYRAGDQKKARAI